MTSLSGDTPPISDLQIPQFDLVSDISDHHFAGKHPKTPPSSVQKKIMQEWKLLSKDLPETIFVRVYENRVNILRAAIVGARGTPYHDGLFFFDVAFPSDYPARPPFVYYWSFGYRLNPNLYSNGRVCLSLLNTWLLLSIQALVLNEKPYFNEPGYSGWSGRTYGEKKSLAYSEDVFVLSCKTMLRVLRKPPQSFELVVAQHFKDNAEFILSACDAYRKGFARVGCFNGAVKGTKGEVSVKFKVAIDLLYEDLVMAMLKTGASVEHFAQQAREEREKKAKEKAEVAAASKNKRGVTVGEIGRSFVQKLKKIVSLGSIMKNKSQKSKTIPV
ncbi:hypothetical protein SOVF_199360 [Spinacia oleracea]|nr:hypothetical protein SOVF_199360 [Spinacia oleracea]